MCRWLAKKLLPTRINFHLFLSHTFPTTIIHISCHLTMTTDFYLLYFLSSFSLSSSSSHIFYIFILYTFFSLQGHIRTLYNVSGRTRYLSHYTHMHKHKYSFTNHCTLSLIFSFLQTYLCIHTVNRGRKKKLSSRAYQLFICYLVAPLYAQ